MSNTTSTTSFSEVLIIPLCFFERPTLVLVFANQKKSKEDVCFMKKSKKQKSCSVLVYSETLRSQHTPDSTCGAAQLLPRELHSASQGQATIVLNCVCEHLCFISIYFVRPLARCVLMYQKSLKEVILGVWKCSKNFPYTLMVIASLCHSKLQKVSDSGGNLYNNHFGKLFL